MQAVGNVVAYVMSVLNVNHDLVLSNLVQENDRRNSRVVRPINFTETHVENPISDFYLLLKQAPKKKR